MPPTVNGAAIGAHRGPTRGSYAWRLLRPNQVLDSSIDTLSTKRRPAANCCEWQGMAFTFLQGITRSSCWSLLSKASLLSPQYAASTLVSDSNGMSACAADPQCFRTAVGTVCWVGKGATFHDGVPGPDAQYNSREGDSWNLANSRHPGRCRTCKPSRCARSLYVSHACRTSWGGDRTWLENRRPCGSYCEQELLSLLRSLTLPASLPINTRALRYDSAWKNAAASRTIAEIINRCPWASGKC